MSVTIFQREQTEPVLTSEWLNFQTMINQFWFPCTQAFGLVKGQNVALLVDASDSNCGYGRLQLFQESLGVWHQYFINFMLLWKFEADKAICKWSLSLILKGAYWWAVSQQRKTIPGIIWNPTQAIMDSGQGCELPHVSCRLSSRR